MMNSAQLRGNVLRLLKIPVTHFLLGFFCIGLLNSCAPKKDAGAYVAIAVTPEKPFIVPGKGASCVSLAKAKVDAADVPESDVVENRILYSAFKLNWKSVDALTVVSLKATVTGFGIDGENVIKFDETEIAALLGKSDLTIPKEDDPGVLIRSVNVISNDVETTKPAASKYAACGLHLGGIKLKEGVNAFTAQVKIELVGFATSRADGSQSPIRKTAIARAELF